MLRIAQLGISFGDLHNYSIGMITDMMTESTNDTLDYPELATTEDARRL